MKKNFLLAKLICLTVCVTGIFPAWGAGGPVGDTREMAIFSRLVSAGWDREIAETISRKILKADGRKVAIFDHDGTLIQGDICEGDGISQAGIIKDLILLNRLKPEGERMIPPEFKNNVLESYKKWLEKDKRAAYAWFPSLLCGYSTPEIQILAMEYYQKIFRHFLFCEMLALLEVLEDTGVEVYIISASPAIIVKEASPWTGIPRRNILGINYKMATNGTISRVQLPISFSEGKTFYIQNYIGEFPTGNLLVFGDSYSTDGHMLRFAARQRGIAVLINPPQTLIPTLQQEGIFHQTLKRIH